MPWSRQISSWSDTSRSSNVLKPDPYMGRAIRLKWNFDLDDQQWKPNYGHFYVKTRSKYTLTKIYIRLILKGAPEWLWTLGWANLRTPGPEWAVGAFLAPYPSLPVAVLGPPNGANRHPAPLSRERPEVACARFSERRYDAARRACWSRRMVRLSLHPAL